MEKDNVLLSRRRSGGGAVYQDLGNSCFTFITPVSTEELPLNQKETNFKIILNSMKNLGIIANLSGRNDIVVGDSKISGSAFQVSLGKKDGKDRKTLHHGTMLINLNKEAAQTYLNVNKEKLKSKGVDSVRSRIMNVNEINKSIDHNLFTQEVKNEFIRFYNGMEIEEQRIDLNHLNEIPKLKEIYNELKSNEWLYQATPKFTNNLEKRFAFGLFDFYVNVENGKIVDGKVYSDSLYPDLIDQMNLQLNSKQFCYDFNGIRKFSEDLKIKFPEMIENLNEIEKWLLSEI